MRLAPTVLIALLLTAHNVAAGQARGVRLEDLSWPEAEKLLRPETVIVIPLGAESKEHGPHLRLANDFLMASYLADEVRRHADVVIAPAVNYSFYPAFLEYPGATSLRYSASRDQIVDVCRDLARFGPRRFYVLNTGVSTNAPLEEAAAILHDDGIDMRFTNLLKVLDPVTKPLMKEPSGTHADEIETSMMLYIAPKSVEMKKAVRDIHEPKGAGGLTRDASQAGVYSPSGVVGDATLATREKGKVVTESLVKIILSEIEALRHADPPQPKPLDVAHFTGTYRTAEGKEYRVAEDHGAMTVTFPNKFVMPLRRDTPTRFYSPLFGAEIRFIETNDQSIAVVDYFERTTVAVRQP